jgi:2-polyprenyl-6-methoxyphenol hydroxylase-like FAD-dependent oxidoreductase
MARILIVGGSLGGLFAANMLHRSGHEVRVLEKAKGSLSGRGAGIVSHDALVRALGRAGLEVADSLGVAVQDRVLLAPDGQTLERLHMPQVLTSWSRLYELLRQAFPAAAYLQGVNVTQLTEHAGGVQVQAQGEGGELRLQADLVVASDGIRSLVRQQLFPEVSPQYAGYVAWRGVCEEALLSQFTLDTLFDHFGFCVPENEQMIGYPVAGADRHTARGHRAYNFVWYRPAADGPALRTLLTDADGVHHPQGIAPNKTSWREIARMREDARRLLAPQFAEIIEKCAQPFLQPIFDLLSPALCQGRVALMGDAAFVARPHIGMGVAKAAMDALALCDAIDALGPEPQALRHYEQSRLPAGRQAVARARWLGQSMRPDGGKNLQPERMRLAIRETAIDLERYGHQSEFKGVAP